MKDTLPARVRFGAFELDLKAGELCQPAAGDAAESRVVLAGQPFRLLVMLIERDGEIVTREEIQKKLWPNDTIVEFDHSINVAIGKLRKALSDSAEEPQYVETVARRGYRLTVPVERIAAPQDSPGEVDAPPFRPSLAKGWEPTGAGVAAVATPEPGALTGRTVSHYRVLDIIGGGGMGVVYRAEDLKLGRQVALKFLPEELGSDPQALERFSREARAASSLDHPNICSIYEFGEHEGRPFMVMQLLEGQTLRDRLASIEGALPLEELLDIGIQVSDGLQAAHERGIIHRDIKPANIFLTSKGVCKILDFGIAKLTEEAPGFSPAKESGGDVGLQPRPEVVAEPGLKPSPEESGIRRAEARRFHPPVTPADATLTRAGLALGTAGYMSPEQVRGEKLDARTDLFSFGLVLYEMATGQRAFSGETAAIVHDAIVNQAPIPVRELNSALPAKLATTIDKALAKVRERRYQRAAEMRADLEGIRSKGQRARRRWASSPAVAFLVLLAVAVGGWLYWRSRNVVRLTDKDTIVLADFTNLTSDKVFDATLKKALLEYLRQTPFLSLLSDDKVHSTLKLLNRSPGGPLNYETTREVCLRTNSKAMLLGSIADAGNRYHIDLKAVECKTETTLAETSGEAGGRHQVLKALGVAGDKLRRKLGEPPTSLEAFGTPIDEATTSSLDALEAFVQAAAVSDPKEGMRLVKRALELDPKFALAYLALATWYANNKMAWEEDVENYTRAYELRDRTTQYIRFEIEEAYYGNVTGEVEKAIRTTNQADEMYPALRGKNNLPSLLLSLGHYEKAVDAALEQHRAFPDQSVGFWNLAAAYIALDQLDDAKTTLEQARSEGLDDLILRIFRYKLSFLRRDEQGMQTDLAWAAGKPEIEDKFLGLHANTEAYYGRHRSARASWNRAVSIARHLGNSESAAGWVLDQALADVAIGNASRARQNALEALELGRGQDVEVAAALVFAAVGDLERAKSLADKLNWESPLNTIVQTYSLPSIRAEIALAEKDASKAVAILEVSRPYEFGEVSDIGLYPIGALYPAYLRGIACLQSGQAQQAAAEFEKLIKHPGIVANRIYGALARLQLGRAQAMMGDKAAARKSYQDFLTLWKDADPDIPIYRQATAEYAKLG